jgi:hypothetical protein
LALAGALSLTFAVPGPTLAARARAAVTFGPQRTVAEFSWTAGSAIAATGGAVHALFTTDRIATEFATDDGPFMGVYLSTSTDRGQTWSAPTRVSQDRRHADRGAIASDGSTVYAVWVAHESYDAYDPADPRALFFRANRSGGQPGSWGRTIQVSPGNGRVDYPSVAAAGGNVYVAWVAAKSGEVRLATSRDGGQTFTRKVVGKTRSASPEGEGLTGLPAVAATGDDVGVAWIANGAGAVNARTSSDAGSTWGATVTLTSSGALVNHGSPAAGGGGAALAFAWTTRTGAFARVWRGSFGPTRTVASFASGQRYKGGYDAEIAVGPPGTLGIAWSGCRTARCDVLSADARIDLLYAGSSDGGVSWSPPELVRGSNFADQRMNDGAGIAWLDANTRIVGYSGYASGLTSYGLFLRVGQGI